MSNPSMYLGTQPIYGSYLGATKIYDILTYTPPPPPPARLPLEETSWADIQTISKAGLASEYWAIGDQKTIYIDGVAYLVDIIGFDHDIPTDTAAYGRNKVGITFQLHNLLATTYKMNDSSTNVGGWKESNMRTNTMPVLFNQINADLQTVIVEVNKVSCVGGATSDMETTSDRLFLLAEIEIAGSCMYSANGEGTRYAYYKSYNNLTNDVYLKQTIDGAEENWWTRSATWAYDDEFCAIANDGGFSDLRSAWDSGVSFAFCV